MFHYTDYFIFSNGMQQFKVLLFLITYIGFCCLGFLCYRVRMLSLKIFCVEIVEYIFILTFNNMHCFCMTYFEYNYAT